MSVGGSGISSTPPAAGIPVAGHQPREVTNDTTRRLLTGMTEGDDIHQLDNDTTWRVRAGETTGADGAVDLLTKRKTVADRAARLALIGYFPSNTLIVTQTDDGSEWLLVDSGTIEVDQGWRPSNYNLPGVAANDGVALTTHVDNGWVADGSVVRVTSPPELAVWDAGEAEWLKYAQVPSDAMIQPPQAFIDAMPAFALSGLGDCANKGIISISSDLIERHNNLAGSGKAGVGYNIALDGNPLNVTTVNLILTTMAGDVDALSNPGVISLGGATPTGAGATAKTTLEGNGWTVLTGA